MKVLSSSQWRANFLMISAPYSAMRDLPEGTLVIMSESAKRQSSVSETVAEDAEVLSIVV